MAVAMGKRLWLLLLVGGVLLMVLGLAFLPEEHGRFEYAIEIADARPYAESAMPAGLGRLGAVRLLVMTPPEALAEFDRILLLPEAAPLLTNSDSALGPLPRSGTREVAAGAGTAMEREDTTSAGGLQVVSRLQTLGAVFDRSLAAVGPADELAADLEASHWRSTASYLLPASSWGQRAELMARLQSDQSLLPTPEAEVISPARRPPLSRGTKRLLAAALIVLGAVVAAVQLRGVSLDGIRRRLRRT